MMEFQAKTGVFVEKGLYHLFKTSQCFTKIILTFLVKHWDVFF